MTDREEHEPRWIFADETWRSSSLSPARTVLPREGRRFAAFEEREVGAAVIPLHDRLIPGTRGNIDHIFVVSTRFWVVDLLALASLLPGRRAVATVSSATSSGGISVALPDVRPACPSAASLPPQQTPGPQVLDS